MARPVFIGIEIGGTKVQVVVGDAARVIRRSGFKVERDGGAHGIRRGIEMCLDAVKAVVASIDHNTVAGVGAGFGGPVEWPSGRISRSHQIDGWEGFDLRAWLAELVEVPVTVDNDANTAALGEALSGAGVGCDTVFYANFGSGVGGGLVTGGAIYHGAPPGEMEFGHLRLDRGGATVESRCSGWAVDKRIRQLAREAEGKGHLAKLIGRTFEGEAKHLSAALAADDPMARQIIDEVAGDIGFALSHVVHLAHPDVIVLGGGLSLVGEPLRAAVAATLRPHVMEAFAPGPDVKLAALGEDAVPVGALHLAVRGAAPRAREQGTRA